LALMTLEERVQKALQLFDLMEKFVERARKPVAGQPLVYDPGDDDLPMLPVPTEDGGNRAGLTICPALFSRGEGGIFRRALDAYCGGRMDDRTVALLQAAR
jgi:hypothetical protein